MKSLDWMTEALCAQIGPDLFFPEGTGNTTTAGQRICATCPVRIECGEHAQGLEGDLPRERRHGMWGGQSPRKRAQQPGAPLVSDRDQAIIRLTSRGMIPAEIATQLDVNVRTVLRVRAANRQEEAA